MSKKRRSENEKFISALIGLLILGTPTFWVMSLFEVPVWCYFLVAFLIMGGMMSEGR